MKDIDPNHIYKVLSEASNAILKIYKQEDPGTEIKPDNSPVTLADKISGKILNKHLKKYYPGIPVLNEENLIPDYTIRSEWKEYFLVDPLDGTKEFIKKNGEFCINVALIRDRQPTQGWIYQPIKDKGWYCKKGAGIIEFDGTGKTSQVDPLPVFSERIRIVASRSFFKPKEKKLIERIAQKYPVQVSQKGSSLKQIAMVLQQADMYLKGGPCSEWDTAPGQLMVEESGGAVFRIDNFKTLRYNKEVLKNPHFVMLNQKLNNQNFINFLKEIM